jgi:hypothetical protein
MPIKKKPNVGIVQTRRKCPDEGIESAPSSHALKTLTERQSKYPSVQSSPNQAHQTLYIRNSVLRQAFT